MSLIFGRDTVCTSCDGGGLDPIEKSKQMKKLKSTLKELEEKSLEEIMSILEIFEKCFMCRGTGVYVLRKKDDESNFALESGGPKT